MERQEAGVVHPYSLCWIFKDCWVIASGKEKCTGKKRCVILNAPQLQQDYAANFNAIDQNNCDSADYSTSVRTMQWYMHLFCWILYCVIHVVYVVICNMYNGGIGRNDWKRLARRNGGRGDFQVALGIALIIMQLSLNGVIQHNKNQIGCAKVNGYYANVNCATSVWIIWQRESIIIQRKLHMYDLMEKLSRQADTLMSM